MRGMAADRDSNARCASYGGGACLKRVRLNSAGLAPLLVLAVYAVIPPGQPGRFSPKPPAMPPPTRATAAEEAATPAEEAAPAHPQNQEGVTEAS